VKLNIKPRDKYQLEIDERGNLWVYDSLQLYRYDFKEQLLHTYNINNVSDISFCKDKIIVIQQDLNLYLLNYYSDEVHKDESFKTAIGGISMKKPMVFLDSHDCVWIYNKFHDRLYLKTPEDSKWNEIKSGEQGGLPSIDVRNIKERSDGTVIVSMGRYGLYQWDSFHKQFICFEEINNQFQSIACDVSIDRDDIIWVGFETQGLACVLPAINQFEHFLPSKLVNTEFITHSDRTRHHTYQ